MQPRRNGGSSLRTQPKQVTSHGRNEISRCPLVPCLSLFTPLVLLTDLRLFLRREVIGNIESRSDFLRRLPLNHTGHSSTSQIQQRLDIHVVRSENQLKQQNLFQINKIRIPLLDNVRHVLTLERLLNFRHGVLQIVLTKFDHLLQNLTLDIGQRNFLAAGIIIIVFLFIHHGLHQFTHASDIRLHGKRISLFGDQVDFVVFFNVHGYNARILKEQIM
mmetsp:Transcript_53843/g.155461  ORF Transcript_53843/g.155461 Transcript_53843/m.155461 type:complete len:218 (+) Transcript_53843:246-899(+)